MWSRRRRRQVLSRWRQRQLHHPAPAAALRVRRPARRARRQPDVRSPGAALGAVRRYRGWLVPIVAATALVISAGYIAFSGAYKVHGAAVSGNQRVSARAIYEASGLQGASIFALDTAAAERRIMALDGIRQARVRAALPARVAIAVEETRPALLWQSDGAVVAVDEGGLALPAPADPAGLARVRELGTTLRAPGERIDPALVDAALSFAARFGDLTYRPGVGFATTTPEGWEVRLGTDGRLAPRQVTLLEAARAQLAGRGEPVAFLDLRYVSRPYYRLRGESE
jgi:hypothetical protein